MTFAALEIVEEQKTEPEDDIVHICCIYCDPDHMFCGLIVEGQDWVANPKPEDECVVCINLEDSHVCTDGFKWNFNGDDEDDD